MRSTLVPTVAGMVALAAIACDRTPAEPSAAELAAVRASRVASSAAQATPTPATAHAQRFRHHGPIAWLLASSDDFGLTVEQENRLKELQSSLEAKNRPLMEQVHATLGPATEGRRRHHPAHWTPEQRAAIEPLMEQIHENVRATLEEVRTVLTDEQWERIEALRAEHRNGRHGRGRWSSHAGTPHGAVGRAP